MKFFIEDKKVKKSEVEVIVGKERLAQIVKEAKADYAEDPETELSYMTKNGMLSIEF